jgi:hypothetical protein
MVDKKVLASFLSKAKKRTYASKMVSEKRMLDNSKELIFKEGKLVYKNRYFGLNTFSGQELIFYDKKLIWSMAYRGGLIEGFETLSSQCYIFLKTCLKKLPKEFPVRGPKDFKKGNFRYFNNYRGELDDFVGVERIFWKDQVIYSCNYFGGMGKPRKKSVVV